MIFGLASFAPQSDISIDVFCILVVLLFIVHMIISLVGKVQLLSASLFCSILLFFSFIFFLFSFALHLQTNIMVELYIPFSSIKELLVGGCISAITLPL